jgi:hypothetical protein
MTEQLNFNDHVNAQKQAVVAKAQDLVNTTQAIIDSWINNFVISEQIKTKRTEQVNFLLGFINQLSQEGIPQLNTLGEEIKDPLVSNKVLEVNNILMTAARSILDNVQQQETAFQKELADKQSQAQAAQAAQAAQHNGKTEVKVHEV